MAYIMTFYEKCGELDDLRRTFILLDKSNDGLLTLDEIREGLMSVMGQVKGNSKIF